MGLRRWLPLSLSVLALPLGCTDDEAPARAGDQHRPAYGANVVIEDMRGPGGTLREITTLALGPDESELVSVNGMGGILAGQNHQVGTGVNPLAAPADRPAVRRLVCGAGWSVTCDRAQCDARAHR